MIGMSLQHILEQAAHRALDMSEGGRSFSVMVHPAGIQIEGVVVLDDVGHRAGHRAGHLIPWPDVNRGSFDIFDAAFKWVGGQLDEAV